MDPYRELGISPDATEEEIKTAYRSLAKRYHPDANPREAHAAEKMNRINAAYKMLREGSSEFEGDRYGEEAAEWFREYMNSRPYEESQELHPEETGSGGRRNSIFYNPVFRRVLVIGIAVCMVVMGILSSFISGFWA